MRRLRIIFVPANYRLPCDLGWAIGNEGRIELDTGEPAHHPGQVWFMGDEEDTSPGRVPS